MKDALNATRQDPYVMAFPEIASFWEAAARHELILPRCNQCNRTHWHPRAQCPFCRSTHMAWVEASGAGTVYSWSVVRRPTSPYVVAWVELAEGPILLTNVLECDVDTVCIGMPVQVFFRPTAEGRCAPVFRPVVAS
jgi:uncharacterized OB-fold protein